ncbi:similar to Saccharomyces cerevisiae YFL013C IES1 Subunit of the INO80 chromatin remodeling complex [Maudiozyma saulgeensis]|uniref:Similar to Saccharomyces cerevisiae YFL013C IES1 Subunit of the INO80 chromatin remodeling complex n=1 Tax=Maudiozyma saulgeensis TaxID=1789683 RepID=A0A1X7QYM1_9SACH|nr:similar to Saccharomyces cerevisiae YFL013C IES1 Subunit of the INO80 chromatin remodeling complex [Kazachstania saulgeensis]
MGGRVYDPIHDVFQDTTASTTEKGAPEKTETSTTSHSMPVTSSIAITLNSDDDDDDDDEETNDESDTHDDTKLSSEDIDSKKTNTMDKNLAQTNKFSSQREYAPMISALRYNRHLKKPDGDYFSRKDLQFHFLETLLDDKRLLFTNVFKDYYLNSLVNTPSVPSLSSSSSSSSSANNENSIKNITTGNVVNVGDDDYDARKFMNHDKLTFSQLYILCLGTSTKSSKILRDKLLSDRQVAFSTCLLGFLLNIGRLNTTINFYIAMTSQLRTFHAIPALQRGISDPKSLQDTPRLKSILKGLPIGNDPISIMDLYQPGHTWKSGVPNIINLLFAICDNVTLVNSRFFDKKYLEWDNSNDGMDLLSLFNVLDQPRFKVEDRSNLLLWLVYIHLETDLSDEAITKSLKQFGKLVKDPTTGIESYKIVLEENDKSLDEEDVDLPEEIAFGLEQRDKRKEFLDQTQKERIKEAKERVVSLDSNYKNVVDKGKIKIEMITSPNLESSEASSTEVKPQTQTPISFVPNSPPLKRKRITGSKIANILNPVDNDESPIRLVPKAETTTPPKTVKDNTVTNQNKFSTGKFEVASIKKKRKRRTKAEMLNAKRLDAERNGSDSNNSKDITPITSSTTLHYNSETPTTQSPVPIVQTPLRDFRQSTEYKSAAMKINEERVSKMIRLDATKQLAGVEKTQKEFVEDLLDAHEIVRQKRKEIGLIKIFNEYEDITMASVIGIRGKKRKKFQDELLGFETDCLRDFMGAKKIMLYKVVGQQEERDIDKNFFKL